MRLTNAVTSRVHHTEPEPSAEVWYEGDFVKNGEGIEEYVAGYLNADDAEFARNNKVAIKYLDYDWGLNEQK